MSSAGVPAASLVPGTLGHLVAAVGAGTAWYSLVSWPPGVPVEIDLAVWARRTSASPAWVVRHAQQRIARLGGRAAAVGISLESGFDPGRLTAREETALLSLLAEFPAVVAVAGRAGEPHRVARYLESVAAAWSACDQACPVLPRRGRPEPDLARARLTLAEAAGTVLANGLSLLGAPG
jgi:arginyl-tRNA synthetase